MKHKQQTVELVIRYDGDFCSPKCDCIETGTVDGGTVSLLRCTRHRYILSAVIAAGSILTIRAPKCFEEFPVEVPTPVTAPITASDPEPIPDPVPDSDKN